MTINWQLRATMFRLMAVVYVEFGEEAFKGRYGNFAKLFGQGATYDAVKSFFAKEIAKVAEEIKAQHPDHQSKGTAIPRGHLSKPPRRPPPHLYFNDEDISIVSEREVERDTLRWSRGPTANDLPVFESSQPPEVSIQSAHDDTRSKKAVVEITRSEVAVVQPASSRSEIVQPANLDPSLNQDIMPTVVQSSAPQRASQTQAKTRKRPYSAIEEPTDDRITQSPRLTPATSKPESFAYVTNRGEYRCALCLSELNSQEALEMHESVSKLHLRNLGKPAMVSKARIKLAQVTAIPPPHPSTFRPLKIGGFDRESTVNDDLLPDNPCNIAAVPHQDPNQDTLRSDSTLDMIEALRHSPISSSLHLDLQTINTVRSPSPEPNKEKGKGVDRGATVPPPITRPSTRPSIQPEARATTITQITSTDHDPKVPQLETSKRKLPNDLSNSDSKLKSLPATEVAEILLSAGLRLAEKCLETHPDLIAEYFSHVQRETAASSNSTSFSNTSLTSSTSASTADTVATAKARIADNYGKVRREMDHGMVGDVIIVDLD